MVNDDKRFEEELRQQELTEQQGSPDSGGEIPTPFDSLVEVAKLAVIDAANNAKKMKKGALYNFVGVLYEAQDTVSLLEWKQKAYRAAVKENLQPEVEFSRLNKKQCETLVATADFRAQARKSLGISASPSDIDALVKPLMAKWENEYGRPAVVDSPSSPEAESVFSDDDLISSGSATASPAAEAVFAGGDKTASLTANTVFSDDDKTASPTAKTVFSDDDKTASPTAKTVFVDDDKTASPTAKTVFVDDDKTASPTAKTVFVDDDKTVSPTANTVFSDHNKNYSVQANTPPAPASQPVQSGPALSSVTGADRQVIGNKSHSTHGLRVKVPDEDNDSAVENNPGQPTLGGNSPGK